MTRTKRKKTKKKTTIFAKKNSIFFFRFRPLFLLLLLFGCCLHLMPEIIHPVVNPTEGKLSDYFRISFFAHLFLFLYIHLCLTASIYPSISLCHPGGVGVFEIEITSQRHLVGISISSRIGPVLVVGFWPVFVLGKLDDGNPIDTACRW